MGAILRSVREGHTNPIIFPLTLNDLPANLHGLASIEMTRAGWDGRLVGTTVSSPSVTVFDEVNGYVSWTPGASDLVATDSPYRIFFWAVTSDGGRFAFGEDDYFLLQVYSDLT